MKTSPVRTTAMGPEGSTNGKTRKGPGGTGVRLPPAPPTADAHPDHVYAAETEAGGVHTCRCGQLVIWGLTNKGKRARFDYPADIEGRHANHHIACPLSPGKKRTGRLLDPSDAPADCGDCRIAMARGNALCSVHWAEFRAWMSSLKPDAYTIWRLGDRKDRRQLLLHWRRHVVAEAAK